MKIAGVLAVVALVAGFVAAGRVARCASVSQVQGLPRDTIRLRPAQIIDRQGFERPMVASTVLIPVGWRARGGVVWNLHNHCGNGYNIDFSAVSPDGLKAVRFLPMETWHWNSLGRADGTRCRVGRIGNIRQYLDGLSQRIHTNARMIDFRPRPDLARKLQQLSRVVPMPMGEIRTWIEAGEALVAYRLHGVDMREVVAAVGVFSVTRTRGMAGMPPSEFFSLSTLPGFAMRAPNGLLNLRLAEAIRSSARASPEWNARISAMNAQTSRFALRETQKRSQIISRTGNAIRRMQQDTWNYQQALQDRLAREESEAIRGVETYNDPLAPSGRVQLSNQYRNAWRLNDGTYVLGDDASFNPYAATGQNGVRLEPTQ